MLPSSRSTFAPGHASDSEIGSRPPLLMYGASLLEAGTAQGQIWSKTVRIWLTSAQAWPTRGRCWSIPGRSNSGPMLVDPGPSTLCRAWPMLGPKTGRSRSEVGRGRPQHQAGLARSRSNPTSHGVGRCWENIGLHSEKLYGPRPEALVEEHRIHNTRPITYITCVI